ncbi:polymer-forming cytoskeletal protein [Viridibacterium curvum]|uniref:Polymer-forming cytoskeletal protein n=1 Tax=Viridibacterium curvum TaxID=1101404 RepID=A0ABP9Q7Z9_9RHOO
MFEKQQSILSKHQQDRAGVGTQPAMASPATSGSTSLSPGARAHLEEVRNMIEQKSAQAAVAPASTTPRAADDEAGSRLIVGPDVKLKGAEIQDCDTLIVEGSVEATMDSRVIRISQGGAFRGKVGIDIAEIHGDFEGELTARQQLIIHATGRVRGQIRYGQVFIESGGILSGDIQSTRETTGLKSTSSTPALPKVVATALAS